VNLIPSLEGRLGRVRELNNHYNKSLKKYARENRKKQTPAEGILWSKLRRKQMLGLRFLRQRSISFYIVDFLQQEYKIIIEIDGASHDEKRYVADLKRQDNLEKLGYSFLRFTEFEVRTRLNEVLESICCKIQSASLP
jgi:very-short-patch-repair endonuclease